MGILQDILDKITNIKSLKQTLFNKLLTMYLVEYGATLEDCVNAVNRMPYYGDVIQYNLRTKDQLHRIEKGYYGGSYTVGIDSLQQQRIIPENIKKDISILGVTGTYTGSGGTDLPTLSNPATAEDILAEKEAYDDAGNKITGTITSRGYALYSLSNKDHIIDVAKGYYKDGVTFRLSPTENEKIIPENIRSGVTILGVPGTYAGSGGASDFTPSSGETVTLRPSGTLDGTSVWCEYDITPVGYTSEYAIFEYTLNAGLGSTSASTGSGYEEYSALIRFSGTNVSERTYCVIVKSWSTAWSSGSTASRFEETGYFAVPITGVPSSVTVLSRFKTTAVSNVASATATVTF